MRHSENSWTRNHNLSILLLLICLTCFGCARKPWTNPLDEQQAENTIDFLRLLSSRAESCPDGIDGDISLSYHNPFDRKNVNGYFQILSPSFIKLIVSNPFGQPILVITSDQNTFQFISTLQRKYITGSVHSFGLLHDIPPALLDDNWMSWIRGIIRVDPSTITEIREDRENRGIWVSMQGKAKNNLPKIHLLIEPDEGKLLSRIIEDDKGEVFTKITYDSWASVGNCKQPHLIEVTGLEYNGELTITLSDVLIADDLDKDDFRFTAPASYVKQILP